MSEESKKSYSTWEEALRAFQLDFQNKLAKINTRIDEIKNIINESPKDDLMAFLEPVIDTKIDSKIDTVVTEKVASASFNKIDEEILPEHMEILPDTKTETNNYIYIDNDFDEEVIFSESDNHDCNQATTLAIAEQIILQEVINVKSAPECGEVFFMSTKHKLFSIKLVVIANGTTKVVKLMPILIFEKSELDYSSSINSGRRIWNPGIRDSNRILL